MVENLINGNELKLDDVLEVAKNLAERSKIKSMDYEFDKNGSKMDNFSRIVKGIARKYSVENFGVEREDLEQDLWVKVMELIDAKGGIEYLDESLVAKCLWNVAVDKYRYHRRRRDSKAEYVEGTEDDNEGTASKAESIRLNSGHAFQSAMDAIFIKETIDLFPKGSRERKYIITKLYMNGEIDPATYDDDDILELPEDDTEESILKLLGYNSRYPASWGAKKSKMREVIYRYLGRIDSKKDVNSEESRLEAIRNRARDIFAESSSYYIYTSKICKDKAMKIFKCKEQDLIEIFKNDEKLVVGIGHSSKKYYLMKNEQKYIDIATEEGDTLLK